MKIFRERGVRMKIFRVINDNGDIEVSSFVNPSAVFQEGLYSEVEELCTYNETFNIFKLVSDYEQLKDNWNKLKEWIKREHREDAIVTTLTWKNATGNVLNKMQEIEKESDSNE